MKVEVIEGYTEEFSFERQTSLDIKIDGETEFSIYELSDCPEDATFSRDLSDCNGIPEMLRKAYYAGKAGEEFSVQYLTEEE